MDSTLTLLPTQIPVNSRRALVSKMYDSNPRLLLILFSQIVDLCLRLGSERDAGVTAPRLVCEGTVGGPDLLPQQNCTPEPEH